uniref:Uncharacterized protein n=1 Tax=Molossus molossus TaxID=27622 RepID=A0A7J8CS81_MOLMO|nr:hypothetical protein HJG59_009795 [Molossus molossus]
MPAPHRCPSSTVQGFTTSSCLDLANPAPASPRTPGCPACRNAQHVGAQVSSLPPLHRGLIAACSAKSSQTPCWHSPHFPPQAVSPLARHPLLPPAGLFSHRPLLGGREMRTHRKGEGEGRRKEGRKQLHLHKLF